MTAVFASATADAETDGECHRGQARRARQEPVALRLKREITVFPALHKPTLRTTNAQTLMRESGESVGFMEQSGINHTVSPLGREADQSGRPRKIWKTWSKAERLSSLERRKRPLLTTSAVADTLPTEGFYD